MAIVLGIDLGTQSLKVLVYDSETKNLLAEGGAPLDMDARDDGTREQDASWWTAGLEKALAALPAELKARVQAIGVSGQQHGFVPLDRDGNVLRPVKLWCDTATDTEVKEMTTNFGGVNALIKEVGNPVLPGYTASKILWMKKHYPDLFAKLDTVLLPHDYLNFLLTGQRVMEYGDASGTALLNVRTRTWDSKACKAIDPQLESKLPKLIESHAPAGRVSKEAAKRFGLPEAALVSSGGGDNMMGAIGTGAVRPGKIVASLGTSGTLFTYADTAIVDPQGEIAAFCSSTGGWLPLLCTMNCTIATEMAREHFDLSLEELNAEAAAATPGSEGVVTLPFYSGERTPNLPRGRASVLNMTLQTGTRKNIIRSSMESAVYGLYKGLGRLEELGIKASEITLIGGGAKSQLWAQIFADIFEQKINVPELSEAAAFGAAIQALWCLEMNADGKTAGKADADLAIKKIAEEHVDKRPAKEVHPDPGTFAAYRKTYEIYQNYLEILSPLYK